jgi:hypothetical protein
MAGTLSGDVDEVLKHFAELEDPRSTINRHHELSSVLVIAIMAILAEAKGPTGIAKWAKLKREFLEKLVLHGI